MKLKSLPPRVAFSPGEFAALFGKSQTWGYRQIYKGKIKVIEEYGRKLIPAAEVERILDKAGTFDGLKIKVPKKGKSLDPWRQFIAERRRGKVVKEKLPRFDATGSTPAPGDMKRQVLARMMKKPA